MVLALNQPFVKLWTGSVYFGGTALTLLFLVNFMARLIDYTLSLALFAFGYEKQYAIRALLDGIISVAVASILVRRFGLQGVILGFTCGALLAAIPIDVYLFAREFQVSIWKTVEPYMPYLWRLLAVGAAGFIVMQRIEISNFFSLALAALVIGLVYLLVAATCVRNSELGGYIQTAASGIRSSVRTRMLGWPASVADWGRE